jgi:MoaA/NifB/PqqE/SkfB family radical SAM enzyme
LHDKIKNIRIDASSRCQLKCPVCPTGQGINKTNEIGSGFLKFDNFRKIIDNNPNIKTIELSNWGEIFLNPEINDIIKYAYEKRVSLTATNGVNFNNVNESTLKHLVEYKFKFLSIAIDGVSQETYSRYRIGGNFNSVLDNIRKINEYKKIHNSKYPVLHWQFIKFGYNQHELTAAKRMAKELKMSFVTKSNWDENYSPLNQPSNANKSPKKKHRNKLADDILNLYFCSYLWTGPQINWDGKLLGCCVNNWHDYGNVFDSSLNETLNNDIYVRTKNILSGKEKADSDFPCKYCHIFINLNKNNLYFILKSHIFITKIIGSLNLAVLFYKDLI